jgi:hypothetical protein
MLLSGLAFYWVFQNNGVQCIHSKVLGQACSTCGISRDFINYLSLQFENPINEKSPFLFFSFALQFLIRMVVFILEAYFPIQKKWIRRDILLSSIHFLIIVIYINL